MANTLILGVIRLFFAFFWTTWGSCLLAGSGWVSMFYWSERHDPDTRDLWLNFPLLLIGFFLLCFGLSAIGLGALFFTRRHHRLCRRLAIVQALLFPVGTVAGIMTFTLLGEAEIRAKWNPPASE